MNRLVIALIVALGLVVALASSLVAIARISIALVVVETCSLVVPTLVVPLFVSSLVVSSLIVSSSLVVPFTPTRLPVKNEMGGVDSECRKRQGANTQPNKRTVGCIEVLCGEGGGKKLETKQKKTVSNESLAFLCYSFGVIITKLALALTHLVTPPPKN